MHEDEQTDVDRLWADYRATRTEALRNQLALQYSPLVKYVAGRVRGGLPANVESADLVSEGVIGLLDAVERFEPERGLAFPTFAVPRIRGAILDSVRAVDWVPRSVRERLRRVDRAAEQLRHDLGRVPTDDELARAADLTVAELRALRERPTGLTDADDEEIAALDAVGPAVDEAFDDEETRAVLLDAVGTLPERDQVIVALYFFEGLTLGEIGQVLGVTESRVSQLRTRATASLRTALAGAL